MKWYTAIGCKMEDDEGRLLVKIDGQEKVLTEMEAMLWAALTWSLCAENKNLFPDVPCLMYYIWGSTCN